MKAIWLGQAGLWLELKGKTVMVDPYLSDSVGEANPRMRRRIPVDPVCLSLRPDILAFTHGHLDHYDPATVEPILRSAYSACVLAPEGVWDRVRHFGGAHNYVLFRKHTVWTQGNVRFTAVYAEHSDPGAIGIVMEAEGRVLYVTGDTL
ncbi:MAG: MBL fold metallo-hydrolase, partial [Oscillospiraceae bacterium]|nr:MBL fold metallo-hydrolase [Oscillospiraceae bacterium]